MPQRIVGPTMLPPVSLPIANKRQNLNLARSQVFVAHVLGELIRYLRRDTLSARVYFAHRPD